MNLALHYNQSALKPRGFKWKDVVQLAKELAYTPMMAANTSGVTIDHVKPTATAAPATNKPAY